jgi:hypothetical protein
MRFASPLALVGLLACVAMSSATLQAPAIPNFRDTANCGFLPFRPRSPPPFAPRFSLSSPPTTRSVYDPAESTEPVAPKTAAPSVAPATAAPAAPAVGEVCIGKAFSVSQTACDCSTLPGGNCFSCSYAEGAAKVCTSCKNGYFLFAGVCLPACPSGYTGVGTGNFGRKCELLGGNRRRAAEADAASASSASSAVSSSATLGNVITMAALATMAIVCALVAVNAQRKQKVLLPVAAPLHEHEAASIVSAQ